MACGPNAPPSSKPVVLPPGGDSVAPPVPALASAESQQSAAAVCGPIKPEEPKQFILRLSELLEHDDLKGWEGMQSERFRRSGAADAGLRKMRFDSWKIGLRERLTELMSMNCRMEGQDSSIACDTKKPLKLRVVREGCELRLDDN
ncbi:MAG: hypothetical protein EOO75_10770 [Myxococcales bacterium]|nr:MAG: hypothetical protein EOO75_10770 [Myxococcales bacterium]